MWPGRSISYLAGPALHTVLTEVCTGLYVVMAELATAPSNHRKLWTAQPGEAGHGGRGRGTH